ncbi:protein FAM83C [Discoglossus pictus]
MLNPEARRGQRPSGQLKNRVEEVKNPWRQSSPLSLNYNETARLAMDALLEQGEKGYVQVINEEKDLPFLSSLDIDFICNSVNGTNGLDDSFKDNGGPLSPSADQCPSEITSGTYFPMMSDIDIPELELGWPEIPLSTRSKNTEVEVVFQRYKSNAIKELIRSLINKAKSVIAVVMDLFTDVDILCDLIEATNKRKVPVYLLLDEKNLPYFIEMYEKLTFNKVHIPKLKIRTVTGDTYCTKSGKKFSGQFLEKFIIIDCEHVVAGSYSFNWLSSHVHSNMVTHLKGKVVEDFDREFRCLYAESLEASYFNDMENDKPLNFSRRWAVKKSPPIPPPIPERSLPSDSNSSSGSQSSVKTPPFFANQAVTVIQDNKAKIPSRVNEERSWQNVDLINGQRRPSDPNPGISNFRAYLKPVQNDKGNVPTSPQLRPRFGNFEKPVQPKINNDTVVNTTVNGVCPEDKKDTSTEDIYGDRKKIDKRRTLGHSKLDLITQTHRNLVNNMALLTNGAESEVKTETSTENKNTNKIGKQNTLGHSKLDLILKTHNHLPGKVSNGAVEEVKTDTSMESRFADSKRMTLGHSNLDLITQTHKIPVNNRALLTNGAESEIKTETSTENKNGVPNKIGKQNTLGHSQLDLILKAHNRLPGQISNGAVEEVTTDTSMESRFADSKRMTLGHSKLDLITQSSKLQGNRLYSRFRP